MALGTCTGGSLGEGWLWVEGVALELFLYVVAGSVRVVLDNREAGNG